jgi:hypothetical protein
MGRVVYSLLWKVLPPQEVSTTVWVEEKALSLRTMLVPGEGMAMRDMPTKVDSVSKVKMDDENRLCAVQAPLIIHSSF